ncbi:hypothetical protein BCR44DRAFT_26571 [Catenaria anguillulae PL171]|uniref:Reelin domain-containing protein n=1 Tax=Catenaria anguillulae PL171 TaxID=765915 RepID=A0A1Y2HM02_9FUNG|nr:hypothetical protein BCR44DRAFT_26571 [Catenaria anguillulae PL171]
MPLRILAAAIALASIALLMSAVPVNAAPDDGFDNCSMDDAAMARFLGGSPTPKDLGYQFNVTALSNTTFTVGLSGTKEPNNPFEGLLMWATDARNQRVGNWQLRPDNLGYSLICGGRAISHNVKGLKTMLPIDAARPSGFQLTVPSGLPQPIFVRAAIFKDKDNWQVIRPMAAPAFNAQAARAALAAMSSASTLGSVVSSAVVATVFAVAVAVV